jgi:hypothetical protein
MHPGDDSEAGPSFDAKVPIAVCFLLLVEAMGSGSVAVG